MLRAVVAATREAFANGEFLEAVESGGGVAALAARGAQLQTLRDAVDALRIDDFDGAVLGSARAGEHGSNGGCGEVKYQHLSQGQGYSMGVFVLPPAGCIPLHSHPGMCVISKLLYGDLRVRSYTFSEDHETSLSLLAAGGVARALVSEHNLSAPATSGSTEARATPTLLSLGPTEGNLHEFTTVGGCAIFDVLAPPYDDDHGRRCIYYRQHSPASDQLSTGVASGGAVGRIDAQPVEVLLEEWPWDTVGSSAGQRESEKNQSVPLTVGAGPDLSYLLSKDRG